MTVRKATVAGAFYPGSAEGIHNLIDRILEEEKPKINYKFARENLIGCVVPHAGYIYSAYEAVHFFEIVRKSGIRYDTFIIINPNHTGYGEYIEVDSSDSWETPMGNVQLDTELADALDLPRSDKAQSQEHSAEVMLPLLQKFVPYEFKVLPISILKQNHLSARELAGKIHAAVRRLDRNVLIIASSDFSHFETPADGHRKDDLVLAEIEKLDSEKLYETVNKNQISVCGYGPIMTLLEYSKLVSKNPQSSVLARGNSGKARPSDTVVDYITILLHS